MASARCADFHYRFSRLNNTVRSICTHSITPCLKIRCRIWDVEDKRKQKSVIVVKSKERGARTRVNTCAYSQDGNMIGGACLDGALHMWNANSNFVRPNMTIEGAHTKGTETGSLVFSVDGRTVLTRGGDDTVKREYLALCLTMIANFFVSLGFASIQEAPLNALRVGDAVPRNERHL